MNNGSFYIVLPLIAAIAILFGGIWTTRISWRRPVLILSATLILLLPILLRPEMPFLRFLEACSALLVVFKMHDLHCSARYGSPPSWLDFFLFLLHPFTLVQRKLSEEPRPSTGQNISCLVRGMILSAVGFFAFRESMRSDLGVISFVVEYVAKTTSFYVLVYGIHEVVLALWRLPGWRGRAILTNIFTAPTPAEFWRRYNRWVGQAFYENVFKPMGGWKSPARATLVVFVITAVMHEYVFTVATGRLQGYQLSFFMLQGVAVLLTQRWKPKGWMAVLGVIGTLIFNLSSGTLFFASWCQILPWYSEAAPAWLSGKSWGLAF